jgi:hypothetical protein
MSKPRAASKAFLKALAKSREEDSRKSPEEKYLDGRGHPQTVRAFGVELTRSKGGGRPSYRGGEPGRQIAIWQNGLDMWTASLTLGWHVITPDLTSSSIPAAIRNLRGHLQNLEISIGKFLKKRTKQ